MKYSRVRESVQLEETRLVYVLSAEDSEDSLTKQLPELSAREYIKHFQTVNVTCTGRDRVSG